MICQTRSSKFTMGEYVLWHKMWLKLLCTNNCVVEEFYHTLGVHLIIIRLLAYFNTWNPLCLQNRLMKAISFSSFLDSNNAYVKPKLYSILLSVLQRVEAGSNLLAILCTAQVCTSIIRLST